MSDPAPPIPQRLTTSELKTVLGKAIQDPNFAKQLKSDPEGAMKSMGYSPHPDEITFFQTLSAGNFHDAAVELNSTDPMNYSAEA